jgi:hypothetical protein
LRRWRQIERSLRALAALLARRFALRFGTFGRKRLARRILRCRLAGSAVRAAIPIGHLRVKLALFIGSLASAGEVRALRRLATGMVRRATLTTATTTATATTASAPATSFATWSVLRRAIARIRSRRNVARTRRGIVAGDGWSCGSVGVRGRLLLALAFALTLTLSLALSFALRVALARLVLTLSFARRLS